MSEKVNVTLKVEAKVRALMEACAQADRRTLSAYVESLVVVDAEHKKIHEVAEAWTSKAGRSTASKEDPQKVYEAILAMELPDEIEFEWWQDFVNMRQYSKKPKMVPLTLNAARLILKNCRKAIDNGWSMQTQFEKATALEWFSPVYDKHVDSVREGYEHEKKMTPQERLELKQRLLNYDGISGVNRGKFVDPDLIEAFIEQRMAEEDVSTAYSELSALIMDFYKKRTPIEENNARIQEMLK